MFRSAVLKLTIQYMVVIMVISAFFSVNLYRISTDELDRSLNKQQQLFQGRAGNMMRPLIDDSNFQDARRAQLTDAKQNVLYQLLYTNIVILFISGGLSYVFARLTIQPIEEAHEKQKRFTSDASHELRTPLAAMRAEIEVNLRDKSATKADLAKVLGSNLEEVGKMQDLVSGLLSLARDDRSKLPIVNFPAYEVIEDVCSKYRKIKGAKIDNSVDKNLSLAADKTYFLELISILIDNAVKYSDGNVQVAVRSIPHAKQVEIQVTDTGVGIGADDLPHIFDRFYRVESSRTKNTVEGYGLGLSLAKKIVELHKGEITVVSKLGEGSTFTIKLPQ